ncbi:MAG TPA: iron ABC transporter permease [archaeon]|nr:iron ABC transporter permease [archaeon]
MRRSWTLLAIGAVSLLVLAGSPLVGIKWIPLSAVFQPSSGGIQSEIFWKIRFPRVCTSFLAGSALAVGGLAFQAMFRNVLATPFTLGVASGASLGATLYVGLGLSFSLLGIPGDSLSAFLGALIAIFLVYSLSRLKKGFTTSSMLLAGVAASFFFSSLILLIQYVSDFTKSFQILRRLIGGIQVTGFDSVLDLFPFAVSGMIVIASLGHELNLLSIGEDIATARGVSVKRVKKLIFLAASLMVAGVVSVCGPIGFVGMMAPHICRLLIGPDHRYLTAASLLFGGGFLTLCDTLGRTMLAPVELPVGVITAILGGPFFLWLLVSGITEHETF